jgi:hypothetical protein
MLRADWITKTLLALLVIGVWALLLQSTIRFPRVEAQTKTVAAQSAQVSPVIKTRGLIIVDDKGRERVVLGAPVPDPPGDGRRINPAHGMIILDPEGYERFGVGLMDNGQMGMGFDAPRGTGDDRNRERIHIVADAKGGAMLRFMNRKTGVPGWMRLGDDDNLYLEFLDVQKEQKKLVRRRIGMAGERTVEEPLE